jgi:hypothetical protein
MDFARRKVLHLSGAATLPAVSRIACAQTYPSRRIRWIVAWTLFLFSRETPRAGLSSRESQSNLTYR